MILHFKHYHFDFVNMYFYADFKLRKNHCSLDYPGARLHRPKHIRPNMTLIQFEEMRLIDGQLKYWDSGDKKWMPIFPTAAFLNEELTKHYVEWYFENNVLK